MNPLKYQTMINHPQELWLENKIKIFIMENLNCKKQEVNKNVRMQVSLYFSTKGEIETIRNIMIPTS